MVVTDEDDLDGTDAARSEFMGRVRDWSHDEPPSAIQSERKTSIQVAGQSVWTASP